MMQRPASRRLGYIALLHLLSFGFTSCGDDLPPPPPGPGGQTVLRVRVVDDASGMPVPAKLLLYSGGFPDGQLIRIGHLDNFSGTAQDRGYCTLADGVIGTWTGIALARGDGEIPIGLPICADRPEIPYGRLRVVVYRGSEYERFETELDLTPGRGVVPLEVRLVRAFLPVGTLAADLHVHAQGSPDSTLPRSVRVMTEAAAGIQVIGSSDHNVNDDYEPEIDGLAMRGLIASVPGNEVTVDLGHFNVFPVEIDESRPNGGSLGTYDELRGLSAMTLFGRMRALPNLPLIQVNHARLGFAAYFDIAGWDGETWPPPMPTNFDTLEVLTGWTSYSLPNDRRLERAVDDFYTFLRNGRFITALGNSDTHHLNGILAGFPRSYVRVADATLAPFDRQGFLDALRNRRAIATTGPWLDARVMDATGHTLGPGDSGEVAGGQAILDVAMRQPGYIHAHRLRIWVGGSLRRTVSIPNGARSFDLREVIPVSAATWLGVDVAGTDPLPEDLVGDYQSQFGGMLPFAIINPIRVRPEGTAAPMLSLPAKEHDLLPPAHHDHPHGPLECGEGMPSP